MHPRTASVTLLCVLFLVSTAPGQTGPLSVYCPSNITVVAPAGQASVTVNYTAPVATPGAQVTTSPPSGSAFPLGETSVAVTASEGTNVASCAFMVSVLTTNDFAPAFGTTNITWVTAGDAPWFVETEITRSGFAAAQSGLITSNQTSTLEATLAGPGILRFWWTVFTPNDSELLYFAVNGSTQAVISGAVPWQPQTVYIGPGPQLLEWTFVQVGSKGAVPDAAGWLDQVSYTPGAVAPFITAQPASFTVAPGLTAALSVTAFGTPPLTYQWQFNGQSIAGATNASLAISDFQAPDAGTYGVVVTSPAGTVLSAGATLTLSEVAAWGADTFGQTEVPPNLTNVVAIAGGWHHSVALKADGTVTVWGDNNAGQTNVPENLSNVVAIASRSGDHIMALRADGTVVDWGDNTHGENNVPAGLSNVVAISAGGYHCLALKADGTAASWGDIATVPAGLSDLVGISAGDYSNLFLRFDGTVAAAGTAVPAGLSNIVAIAAGGLHYLALRTDGTIVAWGDNSHGQTSVPPGLTNAVAIGAGDYHSIALTADGAVSVWGQYYNEVSFFPPVVPAGLTNPVAIAPGSDHDLALFGGRPRLPRPWPLLLYCPSDIAVTAAAGQASVTVNYPAPVATLGAQVTTSPPSGSAFPLGETSVAVTAAEGSNIASCLFTVTVVSADDFGRALGATNLLWASEGDVPWFVETTVTHDGPAAAQSGAVSGGQASGLYTILSGPGTLSFWWSVDSYLNQGVLSLEVDRVPQATITGAVGWEQQSVEVGPGNHLVEWTYAMGGSGVEGEETAWLDGVSYTGQAGPLGVFCPTNTAVLVAPGQGSATVNYPAPLATPGATVIASPPSGSVFPVGDTSVAVTATDGTNTTGCMFTLSVMATNDFGRALGATNLAWATFGESDWFVENTATHGVPAAAQSGVLSSQQRSTLYTGLLGPGTLSFWWSVYTYGNPGGVLSLQVDGAETASISGNVAWAQERVDLGPGAHLVEWIYALGVPYGSNHGWLDQVSYTGQASPLAVVCPPNTVALAGPGQASATVSYPPPLATPGATVTTSPTSGSVFPLGDTSVAVTAAEGTNVASCLFTVSVLATNDFFRALGATNVAWTTGGEAPWFVVTEITHSGGVGFVAQSGPVSGNQTSTLEAALAGPGVLSFWWGMQAVSDSDVLYLTVNGSTQAVISGDTLWQPRTVYLGAGPQALEWTYSHPDLVSVLQDSGWLDQVSYTPGLVAPFIAAQPANLAIAPGLTAALSVTAAGTPPLVYQWLFNGQTIAGATNALLAITNFQAADAGTYSVVVTNPVGTVLSGGAALTLSEVAAWGEDNFGQTDVPLNLTNVIAIAGGWHHSVALKADGTVTVWGDNNAGQTNVPENLSNVVAIASRSGDHIMALRADGTVAVWGDNSHGQTNVPAGLSNVVAIAPGGYQCLVLKANGTAVSWGGSPNGVPAGLSNVVAIAAGDDANLFLRDNGTVAASEAGIPPGLSNVVGIAAGGFHYLALRADGTVVGWGGNAQGQISIPAGLTNAIAIGAGDYHSIALAADGAVSVWGQYYDEVSFFPPWVPAGLTNAVAIAPGSNHDLALLGAGPPLPRLKPLDIAYGSGLFTCSVPTQSGRVYRLEYKNSLADAAWTALPLTAGNGRVQVLSDGTAAGAQRFYRVRRW